MGVDRGTLHRWVNEKVIPVPSTQVLAGVPLKFWTEDDIAKIREYKAARYWGRGGRRKKIKSRKKK